MRTILALKLTAQFVMAAGAAVALFGEPRANGQFTLLGYLVLVSVIGGYVTTTAIEIAQSRVDKQKQLSDKSEAALQEEWRIIEQNPLTSITANIYYRRELPLGGFMEHIGGVAIQITPYAEHPTAGQRRELRFARIPDSTDARVPYVLGVFVDAVLSGSSSNLHFYRRATQHEMEPASGPFVVPPAATDAAPNVESAAEPRLRTDTITVLSVTKVLTPGNWGYTSTDSPLDQHTLICGVSAELPWAALSFGDKYHTVNALGQLHFRIVLPPQFDLTAADGFSLLFSSAATSLGTIELAKRRFSQRVNDGRWEVSLTGTELYAQITSDYANWRRSKAYTSYLESRAG